MASPAATRNASPTDTNDPANYVSFEDLVSGSTQNPTMYSRLNAGMPHIRSQSDCARIARSAEIEKFELAHAHLCENTRGTDVRVRRSRCRHQRQAWNVF
jgi:hypothetical protein